MRLAMVLAVLALAFAAAFLTSGCAAPKGSLCRCDAAHHGAPHRWVVCEVDLSVPPMCIRCEDLVTGKERPCAE